VLNVAYLFTELLFFNEIPEHIDAFVASWHEFKISVLLEIGFFHLLFFCSCIYWNWHLA